MPCPIMSLIFGKALYLIPTKIPLKRYGRFNGHHTYIMVSNYQMDICPIPCLSAYGRTTLP
jgi:hypothetical protein